MSEYIPEWMVEQEKEIKQILIPDNLAELSEESKRRYQELVFSGESPGWAMQKVNEGLSKAH